ncbi:MAG: glycosyltransferase family 39 protein [Sporocytophaga sp.]|nr:glycosyltransferase family 39 protein [Sporocytophaga sp.]
MTGWLKPSDFKYSFEERKYSTVYFTPQRFERLKTALSLFIIPLTVLLVFLWKHTKKLVTKTELFLKFIKDQFRLTIGSFKKITPKEKYIFYIFFLVILSIRLINLKTLSGIHLDEEWSYKYFVAQGPLVTLTYFPDTNNHILFNLISSFLYKIYPYQGFCMKLPVFIQGILLELIVFFSVNRLFNFKTALLALVLTGGAAEISVYSMIGRGHLLGSLFALTSLLSVFGYIKHNRKEYLTYLIISSALGFYTVPTFLYFFVSLPLFSFIIIIRERTFGKILPLIKAYLVTVAGVLILYLPVIGISGLEALTESKWLNPMLPWDFGFNYWFRIYVLEYLEAMADRVPFGNRKYIGVLIVFGFYLLVLIKSKNKNIQLWMCWMLIAAFTPLLVCYYMKVLAPYRVYVFQIVLFFISFSILIDFILRKFNLGNKTYYFILSALLMYMIYNQIFNRKLLFGKVFLEKTSMTSDRNIDHYI